MSDETKAKKATVKAATPKTTAPKKAEPKKTGGTVTVTQIHSGAGRNADQIGTLIGLGLNKMHKTRTLEDTPSVRGMINAVKHLVKVEDAA